MTQKAAVDICPVAKAGVPSARLRQPLRGWTARKPCGGNTGKSAEFHGIIKKGEGFSGGPQAQTVWIHHGKNKLSLCRLQIGKAVSRLESQAQVTFVVAWCEARNVRAYVKLDYPGSPRDELRSGHLRTVDSRRRETRCAASSYINTTHHGFDRRFDDQLHDRHWQALARKWDCALWVSSFRAETRRSIRRRVPRVGSSRRVRSNFQSAYYLRKSLVTEIDKGDLGLWGTFRRRIWST